MKAGDKERLATLRLLHAAVKNEAIARGEAVDESAFLQLVRRAIKQRREAADSFRQGGREDGAAREEREAAILEEYLPAQATEEEIEAAVRTHAESEGLAGPGAMGPMMQEMTTRFAGRADGAVLARIARRILSEREGDG